jgi:hypothetical protein
MEEKPKSLHLQEEASVIGYLPASEESIELIAQMVGEDPLRWPEQAVESSSVGIVGEHRRVLIKVTVEIIELKDKDK